MSWQMGFNWKSLRQEFLVEVFSRLLAHKNTSAVLVFQWSASTPHHLKHIHDRVVDVSMLFAFIELNTHYDNHVTGHRKTPCSILQRS